jgi:hypothetical protein
MHVGASASPEASVAAGTHPATVSALASSLRAAAERLLERYPAVATAVNRIADRLGATPPQPAALLEEHLFALEAVLLERCWEALPETERSAIAERSRTVADRAGGTADTRQRTERASRDRELRRLLALPRLELG